ncbi:MAG: hypothetical protein ASARMPRED_000236 [Alectoria sarmentosa]|nr:MAG: hypothetical protein ASARMPRED_000236 [Alectoria sarmentosa]
MSFIGKKFSGLYAQPMAPFFVADAKVHGTGRCSSYTLPIAVVDVRRGKQADPIAAHRADHDVRYQFGGGCPCSEFVFNHLPALASGEMQTNELSSRAADQFKNDPRNPNSKTQKPADKR